jgi:hypothetical protein
MQLLGFFDSLPAILGFSAYVKVPFACEELTKRLANMRIVIYDHDLPAHNDNAPDRA